MRGGEHDAPNSLRTCGQRRGGPVVSEPVRNGNGWRTYAISGLGGLVVLFGGLWIHSNAARIDRLEEIMRDIGRSRDERTVLIRKQDEDIRDLKARITDLELAMRPALRSGR